MRFFSTAEAARPGFSSLTRIAMQSVFAGDVDFLGSRPPVLGEDGFLPDQDDNHRHGRAPTRPSISEFGEAMAVWSGPRRPSTPWMAGSSPAMTDGEVLQAPIQMPAYTRVSRLITAADVIGYSRLIWVAPKTVTTMKHYASLSFWNHYDQLPETVRVLADKSFALLKENPRHPSLQLKKVGRFWSVRVGSHYRAIATEMDGDMRWHWIGSHEDYNKLIG